MKEEGLGSEKTFELLSGVNIILPSLHAYNGEAFNG